MTTRPILFSAPMVNALLAGTKTQTRRLVKPQPGEDGTNVYGSDATQAAVIKKAWKPYALPGDRLWVKETFAPCDAPALKGHVHYRADGAVGHCQQTNGGDSWWARSGHTLGLADKTLQGVWVGPPKKWKPSIFMTRKASRITLEVTGVRVERLQAISEADAVAEGIELSPGGPWRAYDAEGGCCYEAVESYRSLWTSINGAESWTANPWVWVVEFKRVTP